MLGALEAGLPGAGRPWRGGGTDWALGAGRNRTAVRLLESVPSRGVCPPGFATTTGAAPGPAGAVAPAWADEPGQESGGALPRTDEVVAGPVDLCPRGGGRAD